MRLFASSLLLLSTLSIGCQSFSSTMLNRFDNNSFRGNSNGMTKLFNKTRPYKGVPITLEVPSHLDVYIDETYYMTLDENNLEAVELLPETRILDVRTDVIKTAKVFTVDFKRPGSGTLDLNLTFNDKQYFDEIKSKIEDTTIKDTAALIGQVIGSVKAPKTSAGPSEDDKTFMEQQNIIRDTRVVAYQRFDINAVDFECQVQEFINTHLNGCNQCARPPSYDTPTQ